MSALPEDVTIELGTTYAEARRIIEKYTQVARSGRQNGKTAAAEAYKQAIAEGESAQAADLLAEAAEKFANKYGAVKAASPILSTYDIRRMNEREVRSAYLADQISGDQMRARLVEIDAESKTAKQAAALVARIDRIQAMTFDELQKAVAVGNISTAEGDAERKRRRATSKKAQSLTATHGVFDPFAPIEELRPELVRYRTLDLGLNMTMIQSPFVYSVPHAPELNAFMNRQYEQKVMMFEAAQARGDYDQALWMVEKPFRAQFLSRWADEAGMDLVGPEAVFAERENQRRWWTMIRGAWMESENIFQNVEAWRHVFLEKDCFAAVGRSLVMNDNERRTIRDHRNRNAPVLIYRGQQIGHAPGWSWTTDKDKALWFSRRFNTGAGCLLEGTVLPNRIIACFDERGESEVVCNPEHVYVESRTVIDSADLIQRGSAT